MCADASVEAALQLVCTIAAATERAGGNLAACVRVRAQPLGAQRGQAEPNELQKSVCCEVRESNIPLELCVYTALREGGWQGGVRGAYRKGNKSSPGHSLCASTCRLPRYIHAGPHHLLNHYRRSSAWPAGTARTVYHSLVFRNLILHFKHGSRV